METKSAGKPRPVITQSTSNATLWVGHLQNDPTDHFAGQTFICPSDGQLDNIQVYSEIVQSPGEMVLSLHSFDPVKKTWGTSLVSATVNINRGDKGRWIRFSFPPVTLNKDASYAFRLHANDAMIGIGEGATGTSEPFTGGQEWNADSMDQNGRYYTYFNLAFKVEMCA